MDLFNVGLIYALIVSSCWGATQDICQSPQYFDVGASGAIQCHFDENVYAVAWYNSEDLAEKQSLCRIFDDVKEGEGCLSGEFDIQTDGSLIINNVSLEHDHNFTVFTFNSQDVEPVSIQVKVVVIVKPSMSLPEIEECGERNTSCFIQVNASSKVSCYVKGARPAVPLNWVSRSIRGDRNIFFQASVKQNNTLFTSLATTQDFFSYSSLLDLLVCKAVSPPGVLSGNETFIFIENSDNVVATLDPIVKYIERNDRLELTCSDTDASLIVWKKANRHDDNFHVLFYAALFELNLSRTYIDEYVLKSNGTLVVPRIEVKHEGLYGCTAENSDDANTHLFDVRVYVLAYPVVKGCTQQQYCVLEVHAEGNLTCSVSGIRPQVQLEWKILGETDSSSIVFFDKQVTTSSHGDVFDVQITSRYRIKDTTSNRLTLACRVSGSPIGVFTSTATFDIFILDDKPTIDMMMTPSVNVTSGVKNRSLWILLIIIFICAVTAGLLYLYLVCRKRERNVCSNCDPEEILNMLPVEDFSLEKKAFVSELRAKYQGLYDAVQPIPYIRDRLYNVDRVFVKGGIEYLQAKGKPEAQEAWIKLETYHDIFDDSPLEGNSTRLFIEGDPGYGKSTLTLQFAYDWCNEITASPLNNIEILIFLRLRQLGGVKSIYTAIKQFLLPKDSRLSENHIKNILFKCSSAVVVLDGFDEYPDKDSEYVSDVISIIKREMFQQFKVILTTRSSCLPKEYPPLTKRIKLTGFDENARDQYIRKAVIGDDTQAAQKIKRRLQENPILGDLFQVPFLFVMFAHMSHESENFQKWNSVTSFFRYMMACFHSHLQNKMKDDNVKRYELFEIDHKNLDKLAFEGLSGKAEQTVWRKEDVCQQLGQDFYDQYVRLGILVEEEVLDFSDDWQYIQYKTEVRFYHKLFCEWYAAHFLSENVSRDGVPFKPWKGINDAENTTQSNKYNSWEYLDPFDLQYVYRFACGLNSEAAVKIIAYLKSRDDTHKFAILCFLEQSQKVEDVLKDVEDLCSGNLNIYSTDSRLLQRSTIQLLEIAFNHKISILRVRLMESFKAVDLSDRSIQLKSDLYLPVLATLQELWIWESGKEITEEKLADVLEYSLMCLNLKELRFLNCLLPQIVQIQSLSVLRSRNIRVVWNPSSAFVSPQYKLNLDSGLWQHGDKEDVIKTETYQDEKKYVERLQVINGRRRLSRDSDRYQHREGSE